MNWHNDKKLCKHKTMLDQLNILNMVLNTANVTTSLYTSQLLAKVVASKLAFVAH